MEKYIVITTLSDNLEIIKEISNYLLNNHLVVGCQISTVNSTYWWDNELVESTEYKLEMRTIENNYNKIKEIIKKKHNYKVPEISYYEIKGNNEIKCWIKEYTNN